MCCTPRVEVLARVKVGALSVKSAAVLLQVSYRQAKRLVRRYRAKGAKGLRHGNAGRPSNHARPTAERDRILGLIREKYSGPIDARFGPTLVAEHLASEDHVTIHHDTLRRWMLAAGVWSRARKRSPYRQRRERKAHFGERVQLDGSFHLWYEARAAWVLGDAGRRRDQPHIGAARRGRNNLVRGVNYFCRQI
jgi:transposase